MISIFARIITQGLLFTWHIVCHFYRTKREGIPRKTLEEKSLKFAFVSHVLPPSWSGQAVMIGRVLRDIDPDTYCLISRQNYEISKDQGDYIEKLPGRYFHLPHEFRFPKSVNSFMMMWANTLLGVFMRGRQIARILKRESCDTVVAGTGDLIDLPAAWLASRLSETDFFPYLFDDYACQWPDPAMRAFAKQMESPIFKQIEGVIVPNEFLQNEIQCRYGVTASIVRNPCANPVLEIKRNNRLDDGLDSRIAYMGAIYHVNFGAFNNLIAALERLDRTDVKLDLYTAQPIEFLKKEKICGEHVVFHQHLPPARVAEVQRSADILFLPFAFNSAVPEVIRTSAPGKFGEYLASGTPILAHVPKDSFVSWYLKKHECGLVVDRDDPLVLAGALQQLLDDPRIRHALSRNAQERARKDFSPLEARKRFLAAIGRSV